MGPFLRGVSGRIFLLIYLVPSAGERVPGLGGFKVKNFCLMGRNLEKLEINLTPL